jgi:hypothetical protein
MCYHVRSCCSRSVSDEANLAGDRARVRANGAERSPRTDQTADLEPRRPRQRRATGGPTTRSVHLVPNGQCFGLCRAHSLIRGRLARALGLYPFRDRFRSGRRTSAEPRITGAMKGGGNIIIRSYGAMVHLSASARMRSRSSSQASSSAVTRWAAGRSKMVSSVRTAGRAAGRAMRAV